MKKLAVMVLMASISLTACSSGNEKADNMEVMENIEETTSIEEASTIEETNSIEETSTIEETCTIEETSTIEETTSTIENEATSIEETDESNGVNSVGEDTILGEGDYKETDIEADMILSEDLQKIYDSFSEEDKALYRELMKDVDTSDTTPPSTGTEEVIYSDPDYNIYDADVSGLSTTAVGY